MDIQVSEYITLIVEPNDSEGERKARELATWLEEHASK